MNILFLLNWFPIYGGVEKITILLASALQKKYKIHILSQKGNAVELLELLHPNVVCCVFPDDKKIDSSYNASFLLAYLRREKIDIVINQGIYIGVTRLLSLAFNKDYFTIVSVLHNDPCCHYKEIERYSKEKDLKSLIKRCLGRFYSQRIIKRYCRNFQIAYSCSSKIVLLSNSYVNDFEKMVVRENTNNKIKVISNGVKPIVLNDGWLETKRNKIIYVGRVVEGQKRVSRLIYIWKELANQYNDWELQIIGDGDSLSNLKMLCKNLKISNICFTGYQQNISSYLEEASILCLTSDYEGFPMSIIEGMQYGVIPVVYGSYDAVNDIIEDKKNGCIIPPFKEDIYIKTLGMLMSDSALRAEMAFAAQKASRLFDLDNIVKKWENLFDGILQNNLE